MQAAKGSDEPAQICSLAGAVHRIEMTIQPIVIVIQPMFSYGTHGDNASGFIH